MASVVMNSVEKVSTMAISPGTMLSTVSCSKFLAHSPMAMPNSPKMRETISTQNRNSPIDTTWTPPNTAAMAKIPIAVEAVRNTTAARVPTIIST